MKDSRICIDFIIIVHTVNVGEVSGYGPLTGAEWILRAGRLVFRLAADKKVVWPPARLLDQQSYSRTGRTRDR